MAFIELENVLSSTASIISLPQDGITVSVSKRSRGNGTDARAIRIQIGAKLASKLGLVSSIHRFRLFMGTEGDGNTIKVQRDEAGPFIGRTRENGSCEISINSASAAGLFSLNFPKFSRSPNNSELRIGDKFFSFVAIDAMFSGED